MFGTLQSPFSTKSGTAAALAEAKNVSMAIKKDAGGTLKWHCVGVGAHIVGQVDVANAAKYWLKDIVAGGFTRFKLEVARPGQDDKSDYISLFDLKGKGIAMYERLRTELLINQQEYDVNNNQPINKSIAFLFGDPIRDSFWPNAIPVDRIGTLDWIFDPTALHADFTVDSMAVSMYLLLVKLEEDKGGNYVASCWKEETGFTDYQVKSPEGLIQGAYLINAQASQANICTSVSSDELSLASAPGALMFNEWVQQHPFRDYLDDCWEDPTVAGQGMDYGFSLLEGRRNGPKTGKPGPITWKGASGSFPQTNTVLWRYIHP